MRRSVASRRPALFVCDSYDAMVSDRAHSRAMSQEGALDELRRNSGTQFDPLVVDAFSAALRTEQARTPRTTVAGS
jgi:HD-GYP domain-containing protein (c-di-GMP phosphodiesterase class II)